MQEENDKDRRSFLKTAGAAFVAASLPLTAVAQKDEKEEIEITRRPQPLYLSGCGWNRTLPGIYGQACFAFDVRAEVGGTGVGTMRDDVYQDINSQFAIHSVTRRGNDYVMQGLITSSRTPELIGSMVTITAQNLGGGSGLVSISIESEGDNLVVIAIIACLMALLLPAVQ